MSRNIPTNPTTADVPASELVERVGAYVDLPAHPRAKLDRVEPWTPGPDGDPWVTLYLYTPGRGYCTHAVPAAAKVSVSVVGSVVSCANLRPGDVVTNAPGNPGHLTITDVDAAFASNTALVTFADTMSDGQNVRLVYPVELHFVLANR